MKKVYAPPCAEIIMLVPSEEIASGWGWGIFQPQTSSVSTTPYNEEVWKNPFKFEQNDDSYTTID